MIRKLFLLSAIVAAIALAAVWASPRDSEATTWTPFFGPSDFYRLDPLTPGAATDLHTQFNVNAPSANFSGLFGRAITFGDSDVFVADAAGVPGTGAYIGSLSSVAILGLANEGCNSTVPVTFNFVEANVATTARPFTNGGAMTVGGGGIADATTTTMTYSHSLDPLGLKQGADGTPVEGTILAGVNEIRIDTEEMLVVAVDPAANTYGIVRGWNGTTAAAHSAGAAVSRVAVIYPNGPGTNLLANLGEDDGDVDNNGVAEEAAGSPGGPQTNGNQVADGADLVPSFVRDSQDPNGNADDGGYVPSRARYAGVAFVASSLIVILQFSIMDLGALTVFPNLQWATAGWGYPSVTFLQDPLAPASDSAITDFCNFSSNTFLFGTTHDNLCTGASPPGACTGSGAGFTLRLAVDGGGPTGGAGACPSTAYTPVVTLNGAITAAATSAVYTSAGDPIAVGHVIQMDAENMSVTAVDTGTNTLTITRGQRSSVAAAHANGVAINQLTPVNECGTNRSSNPATAQRLRYYQYSVSQRDYDNDGHENALDTCPYNANAAWNPREFNISSGGDGDADGLPDACDPTPASGSADHDGDGGGTGWLNRLDNCPTVPNTAAVMTAPNVRQYDQDTAPGVNVYDGGPSTDSIGPECDIAGNSCGGCPALTPTGANGHYHAAYAAQTICIGAANAECDNTPGLAGGASDSDGDGVTNASDTCRDFSNPPTRFSGASANSTVSVATGGGTALTVASAAGFTTGSPVVIDSPLETLRYITTIVGNTLNLNAAVSAHGIGDPVSQVSFSQSIRDLNNNGTIGVIDDLAAIANAGFTTGGDPSLPAGYSARFDFNNNGSIGVIDDLATIAGSALQPGNCGPL